MHVTESCIRVMKKICIGATCWTRYAAFTHREFEEPASGSRTFSFVRMSATGGFSGSLMVLYLTRGVPVSSGQCFQMKDTRLSFDSSRTENPMSHRVDRFLDRSVAKFGEFLLRFS